jgi:thiol-disulfide isomerase/thioredoxin
MERDNDMAAARPNNRRWLFIALMAVFLGFYLVGPGGLFQEIVSGELAPDILAETMDGSEFHLHDVSGELVLLDFWASWCGPCQMSAPVVEGLAQELGEGYPSFRVVGINVGESRETARQAAADLGITYTVALDRSQEIAQEYGVSGIPLFVLLDTDRTVLWRQEGFHPDMARIVREIVNERRNR